MPELPQQYVARPNQQVRVMQITIDNRRDLKDAGLFSGHYPEGTWMVEIVPDQVVNLTDEQFKTIYEAVS